MSYYQDEFYDDDDSNTYDDEDYADDGRCGQCGYDWLDCGCHLNGDELCERCGWLTEACHCLTCSHCGVGYNDCVCHLIDSDDDGTQAQGVPF